MKAKEYIDSLNEKYPHPNLTSANMPDFVVSDMKANGHDPDALLQQTRKDGYTKTLVDMLSERLPSIITKLIEKKIY